MRKRTTTFFLLGALGGLLYALIVAAIGGCATVAGIGEDINNAAVAVAKGAAKEGGQ